MLLLVPNQSLPLKRAMAVLTPDTTSDFHVESFDGVMPEATIPKISQVDLWSGSRGGELEGWHI